MRWTCPRTLALVALIAWRAPVTALEGVALRAPSKVALAARHRTRIFACDSGGSKDGDDIAREWSQLQRNLTAEAAASDLAASELDPQRRTLWEQLRRATEVEAVSSAKSTLQAQPAEDAGEQPSWKRRSQALAELQYWLITTGNPSAEAAMIDMIQRFHERERWLAVEADGLLRKAWAVHRDAQTNLRMEEGRALLRGGQAHKAEKLFADIAASCDPPWAEAHRWRAKVSHLAMNNVPAAVEAFERALAISPRNYAVLFELGALLVKDASATASMGGSRSEGSAQRAERGAQLLGRAAELNPLLTPKVFVVLGTNEED